MGDTGFPKVELISLTPGAERLIEKAGRLCWDSKPAEDHKDAQKFIQRLIKNGHHSVIEHVSASFYIECSRACSHQIVRSRIASYSQRSQRYCNEDSFEYIIPPSVKGAAKEEFIDVMNQIQTGYKKLRELGIHKEDARALLPNATNTQLIMTANLREFRHFIDLRLTKEAQQEIRSVARQMLLALYPYVPCVFQDLYEERITNGGV